MPQIDELLQIIAEEVGVDVDELTDDSTFKEFGLDILLTNIILTNAREKVGLNLPSSIFLDHPTVAELKAHLDHQSLSPKSSENKTFLPSAPLGQNASRKDPLSLILQGTPRTCSKILFLLPDGSGSAMAYARLPRIDTDICVVALNSPYLRAASHTRFTVEGIAEIWADEAQLLQPHGPYHFGGWSAGGYYAFEVAKHLLSRGELIQSLVLIDSPCRLVYEALPMEVVHYLSTNNLMGNWSTKSPPAWMVNHFEMAIRAIEDYQPQALQTADIPDISIIWAEEGMLTQGDLTPTELNMNVQVTRMLIERPEIDGAMGWDGLFPGAELQVAKMPGNHFTIVYPPYVRFSSRNLTFWVRANSLRQCGSLSSLLKDTILGTKVDRAHRWASFRG
jgi:thioesterase domain-containing protein